MSYIYEKSVLKTFFREAHVQFLFNSFCRECVEQNNEQFYNSIVRGKLVLTIRIALTNAHTIWYPICRDSSFLFSCYSNKLFSMAKEKSDIVYSFKKDCRG